MKWRHVIGALCAALVVGLTGCSSVEIPQEAMFNNQGSLLAHDFPFQGYALEEVELEVGGGVTLSGRRMYRPGLTGERGALIYYGGQGFHLVLSEAIFGGLLPALQGADVWSFDYRGYGESGGEPGVEALQADALAIAEWVATRPQVDASRIAVHGQSMGSFLATHVARQREVAAVVLEAPITNAEDWSRQLIPWYLRVLFRLEPSEPLRGPDNLEAIEQVTAPTLFVAGGEDFVAPAAMARQLHERSPSRHKELLVLEGAGHNEMPQRAEFQARYEAFLSRAMR